MIHGKGAYLQPNIVIYAKEQWDRVTTNTTAVYGSVYSGLEDTICPPLELVTEARHTDEFRFMEVGRHELDHQRSWDWRCLNPLLVTIEYLQSLDARFLPEDREALQQIRSGTDRASAVRECQWVHLEAV